MKTRVCYLGNPIVVNDCIGILIGRRLEQDWPWAGKAVIREFIGSPLDFIADIEGWDRVVVIDAVVTGEVPPGTVRLFRESDLTGKRISGAPHGLNLPDAFALARKMNLPLPAETVLIGIETPYVGEFGERLTDDLADRLEKIIQDVRDLLARLL